MLYSKQEVRSIKSYFGINDNGGVTSAILWEAAKATIPGGIMAHSSRGKKQREREKMVSENEIKELQEEQRKKKKRVDNDIQTQLNVARKHWIK